MRFLHLFVPLLLVISHALGLAISPRHVLYGRSNSGEATHYGGNLQGGSCGFSTMTSLPAHVYGTATANWDTAIHCGQCVSVTGPHGNTITAMIVDQCPGCQTNQLDLFPDAFSALESDSSVGVLQITWDYVNCPVSSPLQLVNKEGVSAYWFSMQVVDATEEVTSFQVSSEGDNWQTATRLNDNFFTLDKGAGSTTVTVKLTSASGSTITVDNVTVAGGQTVTAQSNFGSSGSTSSTPSNTSSSAASSQPSSNPTGMSGGPGNRQPAQASSSSSGQLASSDGDADNECDA